LCNGVYHPKVQEAKIRGLWFQASPGKKSLQDPISVEKSCVRWCTIATPATVGSIKQEDCGPGWPGQKVRPYLQNAQHKKELEEWLKW
jgi:hypothetical protein